jgi:GT2 family glycosyltransferase
MSVVDFSVIICSVDPWKFTQVCACYERLLAACSHEIIAIHDARSLAEGYNRGLKRSSGEIVIFSHDDVMFLDRHFAAKIRARMASWDLLGFAGASRLVYPAWHAAGWPHLHGAVCHWTRRWPKTLLLTLYGATAWPVVGGIEVLDGLCMIVRRELAVETGFDEDTFDGWHLYDCDFSQGVRRAGHEIGVCCDIPYIHASASVQTNECAFDGADYMKYVARFAAKYRDRMLADFRWPLMHFRESFISGHDELLRLWTEENFRRATLALARDAAYRERS